MSIAIPPVAHPDQDEISTPRLDGPLAETGLHVLAIIQLYEVFHDHLPATDFIAADMYWYWEKGHPGCRAPDVMVVEVSREHRRSFFTLPWRFEDRIRASSSRWRRAPGEDVWEKRPEVRAARRREYVCLTRRKYLRPRLQGQLVGGRYYPIVPDAERRRVCASEEAAQASCWARGPGAAVCSTEPPPTLRCRPAERLEAGSSMPAGRPCR